MRGREQVERLLRLLARERVLYRHHAVKPRNLEYLLQVLLVAGELVEVEQTAVLELAPLVLVEQSQSLRDERHAHRPRVMLHCLFRNVFQNPLCMLSSIMA